MTRNNYRIRKEAPHLEVRIAGALNWCRLFLEGGPQRSPLPCPLAQRCEGVSFASVPFGDFFFDLEYSGPNGDTPAFPLPSAGHLLAVATPSHLGRPMRSTAMADAASLAIVTVTLAWRGGQAKDFELEEDLSQVLESRSEARQAMTGAAARSNGNIQRIGANIDASWRLTATWRLPK